MSANDLTPEQETELRRLAEAATPGPWFVYEQQIQSRDDAAVELAMQAQQTPELGPVLPLLTTPDGLCPATTGCGKDSMANARLIAAMRNALPALLDKLAELRAEVAGYQQDLADTVALETRLRTLVWEGMRFTEDSLSLFDVDEDDADNGRDYVERAKAVLGDWEPREDGP